MTGPKITQLELLKADLEREAPLLVAVASEHGQVGYGETCTASSEHVGEAAEELSVQLLNRDVLARESVWQAMMGAARDFGGPPETVLATLSGIDAALWDLAGKTLRTPATTLMGGSTCLALEICVDCGALSDDSALERAQSAAQTDVLMYSFDVSVDEDEGIGRLRDARKLLGPESLLVARLAAPAESVPDATRIGGLIDRVDPYWIEGLLEDGMWQELASARKSIVSATAAGSTIVDISRFWPALEAGAADVLTPQLGFCGGLTGALKLAEATALKGLRMCLRPGDTLVSTIAATHAAFARRHVGPAWMSHRTFTTLRDLRPQAVEGGFFRPLGEPGLALPEDLLAGCEVLLSFEA